MKNQLITMVVLAIMSLFVASCDDTTESLGNSISNDADKFAIITDTFAVQTRSICVDSVLSRTQYSYIGHVKDTETNTYVTANFATQFGVAELLIDTELLPKQDSIVSRDNDGKIIADSCFFNIYFNSFVGDTLNAVKISAHELQKPIREGRDYYSNFDPMAAGYVRSDGIVKNKVFTYQGLVGSDSLHAVSIPLNDSYVDQQGNTYNNFGTYLMRKYYEDSSNYKNSYNFINNVFPGFYVKAADGIGNMGEVLITALQFHYRCFSGDSIIHSGLRIGGTEEVMQTTNIVNDKERIQRLADDPTCTYLKSPAGIYTEVTLPIDEIKHNHESDTISSAKIIFTRFNASNDQGDAYQAPTNILMLPRDSMYTFFENRNLPDNITSFIASYSSSYNTYTFSNISSLVNALYANKDKSENWNKVVLIPVYVTTNSSTGAYTNVSNDMSLKSCRLVGGSQNTHSPVTISIIYNKFTPD
ncbi:MAG: DUF4270 domain-containing protein [Prevotella sp.]